MRYFWIIGLSMFLFSCGPTEEKSEEQIVETDIDPETDNERIEDHSFEFENAQDFAEFCLVALKEENEEVLMPYLEEELLLSPNAYIEKDEVQRLKAQDILNPSEKVYHWGDQPGSGFPIELTIPAYLDSFVLDVDFESDVVEMNTYTAKPVARGSELHNMQDLFPGCSFVEFYMPPSEEGFIDWSGIYLIVRQKDNDFTLVGIVHNRWTP